MSGQLRDRYRNEAVPAMRKQFGYTNPNQVPRLDKIIVNVGLGEALQNAKAVDAAVGDIAAITGQKPIVTRAKRSIAQFRVRTGNPIGVKVTLRGERMWDFLERLTRLALPHLRATRGAMLFTLALAAKAPGGSSEPSSVTRAAGMALMKALSKELAPDGIRVNAVVIGLIESGQWVRAAGASGVALDEFYARSARDAGVPLGRFGRAAEFADLGCFLLSPRAGYLTGAAINLDGGLSPAV